MDLTYFGEFQSVTITISLEVYLLSVGASSSLPLSRWVMTVVVFDSILVIQYGKIAQTHLLHFLEYLVHFRNQFFCPQKTEFTSWWEWFFGDCQVSELQGCCLEFVIVLRSLQWIQTREICPLYKISGANTDSSSSIVISGFALLVSWISGVTLLCSSVSLFLPTEHLDTGNVKDIGNEKTKYLIITHLLPPCYTHNSLQIAVLIRMYLVTQLSLDSL